MAELRGAKKTTGAFKTRKQLEAAVKRHAKKGMAQRENAITCGISIPTLRKILSDA